MLQSIDKVVIKPDINDTLHYIYQTSHTQNLVSILKINTSANKILIGRGVGNINNEQKHKQ